MKIFTKRRVVEVVEDLESRINFEMIQLRSYYARIKYLDEIIEIFRFNQGSRGSRGNRSNRSNVTITDGDFTQKELNELIYPMGVISYGRKPVFHTMEEFYTYI